MRLDDEESLKAILQDVYKIDQLQVDINEFEVKIASQQSKLNTLGTSPNKYLKQTQYFKYLFG